MFNYLKRLYCIILFFFCGCTLVAKLQFCCVTQTENSNIFVTYYVIHTFIYNGEIETYSNVLSEKQKTKKIAIARSRAPI